MTSFTIAPRAIPRSGDDSPAPSLARYVWRMSGKHQWGICLLALAVAGLSMAPLELQRRIVDGAVFIPRQGIEGIKTLSPAANPCGSKTFVATFITFRRKQGRRLRNCRGSHLRRWGGDRV